MILNSPVIPPRLLARTLLIATFLVATVVCVRAQVASPSPAATPTQSVEQVVTQAADESQPTPEKSQANAGADAVQKRLARARSLAAIGRLAAAATELESLRSSTADESVRDVTRILLMSIFVEMPDYQRAATLLDEAFKARTPGQTADETTHSYYALAGQTINSVRTHLERYRSFGINVSESADLPPEAGGDLEQLRALLEKVIEQAKTLHEEQIRGNNEGTRGLDAAALLEDAATVRMRISRQDEDRARWQQEVSEARQHLFSSEMRIASISEVPATRPAPPPAQPTPNNAPSASATDKTTQPKSDRQKPSAEPKPSKKSGRPAASEKNQVTASSAQGTQTAQPPQQAGSTTAPAPNGDAAKKSGGAPIAVGSLAAKAKQRVSPNYPPIARTARVAGIVTVFLIVNEKGEVEAVQRTDGPVQLQQAAADAARRWKFTPTVVDGQPVRVTGYLSFNFSL